jgi:toxin CptA
LIVSSPSNPIFECHWRTSSLLLVLYVLLQLLAVAILLVLPIPFLLRSIGLLFCLLHASWIVPSRILLSRDSSWLGLRQDEQGWSLWSRRAGWQPVQLRPDSLALPLAVVLRFKLPGKWFVRGICIPRGSMPPEQHRRLRVKLKFSRRKWVEPE